MWELFHIIADGDSARVRKYLVEHDLLPHVRMRNLVYPEVEKDFRDRGGVSAPALWTGKEWVSGVEKILACLDSFKDVGREF